MERWELAEQARTLLYPSWSIGGDVAGRWARSGDPVLVRRAVRAYKSLRRMDRRGLSILLQRPWEEGGEGEI